MRNVCLILALGAFGATGAAAAEPATLAEPGAEQVVRVRKQTTTYFAPGAGGQWIVNGTGPQELFFGVRVVLKGGNAPGVKLSAAIEDGAVLATELALRRQGNAKLTAQKRAKLSQEAVVSWTLPEGSHRVVIQAELPKKAIAVMGRIVATPPKKMTALGALTVPEPPAEVVTEAADPEPPSPPTSPPIDVAPSAGESSSLETIEAAAVDADHSAAPMVVESAETDAPAASPATDPIGLTIGAGVGAGFPQILSDLGTGFQVAVELAYLLPVLDRQPGLFVAGTYSQSIHRDSATDDRLASETGFDYTLVERRVSVDAGALFRLFAPRTPLNFFGRAGVRIDLQRSNVKGDADGLGFGTNIETKTAYGFVAGGGAEYVLGPGAITAQAIFSFVGLDHEVTGDANAGDVALHVGYQLQL